MMVKRFRGQRIAPKIWNDPISRHLGPMCFAKKIKATDKIDDADIEASFTVEITVTCSSVEVKHVGCLY